MLSVVVLDTLWQDKTGLSNLLKDARAKRQLPIKTLVVKTRFDDFQRDYSEYIEDADVFIASFREVRPEYVALMSALRQEKGSLFIVLALDKQADITSIVRPAIRPAGILFIPLKKELLYQTIQEVYMESRRMAERSEEGVFVIRSGSDYHRVGTGEIFYFEAQGKKVAVKTRGQMIAFYSTFDAILAQLPAWFARCHKGYVVNTRQIVQANFADMTLTLRDKSTVPISRTYRDEMKRLL